MQFPVTLNGEKNFYKLKNQIKKIAITGPESTGKSALAEQLAYRFNTVWVPEYAREYLNNLNRKYNYDDVLKIAKGQVKHEKKLLEKTNKLLFSDTELIVTKIWCDVVFGKCHEWIVQGIEKQNYDLYLLMNIDTPWEYDPMREHPGKRDYILKLYLKELKSRHFKYRLITGLGEERIKNAITFVNEIL